MSARVTIDRLAIRMKGLREPEARALARRLEAALAGGLGGLAMQANARLGRIDAGTVPAARGAEGVAAAVGRALGGRPGRGGAG